jgi:hypothetical protein
MGQHHFLKYHKHSDARKKWGDITKKAKNGRVFWVAGFDKGAI